MLLLLEDLRRSEALLTRVLYVEVLMVFMLFFFFVIYIARKAIFLCVCFCLLPYIYLLVYLFLLFKLKTSLFLMFFAIFPSQCTGKNIFFLFTNILKTP